MGPQSDVKNWQNSAAAVQKENKRVEVLKFWHSRRQVTIFKPYWYFASTYSWQCRTEPEKMQIRRQKRGGTVNTNSGQDCSWEESGSGWYLAPSSSSLVWHKSFPYVQTGSIFKRRRQWTKGTTDSDDNVPSNTICTLFQIFEWLWVNLKNQPRLQIMEQPCTLVPCMRYLTVHSEESQYI